MAQGAVAGPLTGPLAVAFGRAAAAGSPAATPTAPPRISVLRVEAPAAKAAPKPNTTETNRLRFEGRAVDRKVQRERAAGDEGAAAIAQENRIAACLTYDDPRWLFAVRVVQSLEGGKSAVLGPTGRRSLVKSAAALGMRPFDANLLIAIVQDEVRQGGTGLSHSAQGRINLIREAEPVASAPIWPAMVMAFAIAGVLALVMMEWVSSAAR